MISLLNLPLLLLANILLPPHLSNILRRKDNIPRPHFLFQFATLHYMFIIPLYTIISILCIFSMIGMWIIGWLLPEIVSLQRC